MARSDDVLPAFFRPKMWKRSSSSPQRSNVSKYLISGIVTLFLVYIAWIRIPPRVSLLNNPEAKKALIELKNVKKAQQQMYSPFDLSSWSKYDQLEEELASAAAAATVDEDPDGDISKERESSEDIQEPSSSSGKVEAQFEPIPNKWDIDPNDMDRKYFVYQPSGGWGNQRMILRWAMRLANAMDRTLIVPMIAPHNKMWYGYDRLNATDMISADRILDMDALEAGTVQGVRVYRDHLSTLPSVLPGSWRRNSKKSTIWLRENAIRSKWRGLDERVIFWNRGSMWECCAGGTMMTPYVMFNKVLKMVSMDLANSYFKGQPYNAVHVRRGGGHTRIDRRSAEHYYEMKLQPNHFEPSLPIFVATDEKNKTWFDYWKQQGFKLVFWADLMKIQQPKITRFLQQFPLRTHNDVIGFLEQLICARAKIWTGSDGSTFSYSIEGMRNFPTLTKIDWQVGMDPATRKIYAHDGKGIEVKSEESDAESASEEQEIQLADGPPSDDDDDDS